jgi:hypothetical protein
VAGPVAKTSARALRFAAAQAQKAPVKQKAEDHPVVGLQQAAGNDAVTELLKSMDAPGTRGRKGFDPRNRQAWSLLGGGNIRKNFPEEFEATLAAAPEVKLAAEERVKRKGPPKEGEELESFEAELRTMIRMQALGLMAAHRATIEGRRDETLAASRGKKSGAKSEDAGGGAAAPTAEETATAIRAAAAQIGKLEELKTELRGYERRIDIVRREVLVSGRSNATIEAWVEELGDATKAYRGDEITERWNNGIDALIKAGRPDAMAAPLWKLAMSLRSWRLGQIAATREAIGQFYDAFPFFAQLEPSKIAKGGYADTPKLMTGVETAFARLLDKVDDAIVEIGTGDIDPYDLPEAMAKVREELPENLLPAYERVMRNHQTREFWTGMGLGLFQAAVIFVPVVGPLIAAGIGVAQAGSHLESMLDRVVMAEASARPEGVTLGVGAPGAFEWAMFGVEAIMAAVDLGGAIKGLRASAAEFGMKRRPPASEERPPTKRSTREEPPEPHEPPPSARKEQAPREKAAKEDVGAARKQTPEETRIPREEDPAPTKRQKNKAEKRKEHAAEKERLRELEREEQAYEAGERPDEPSARERGREEGRATGRASKKAAKLTPEEAADAARKEVESMLAQARNGEFRSMSPANKRKVLKKFLRNAREAKLDTDLARRTAENKMVGDFYEALDLSGDTAKWTGTQKTRVAGGPKQSDMRTKKPTSRTPAAAVRPDQEGQLVLPDGRVLPISRDQKMFRWLDSNSPQAKTPAEAAKIAGDVRREMANKAFNLRTGDSVVIRLPFDPDPAVRAAMEEQFFKPGSPIREVVFGDRAVRNPAFPFP